MPLADHMPRLDDLTFDDLVAQARQRVTRYTTELTDFNPGDPAFALIELNAWMTELLLFRLGRVSDLHYLKFLELVGIDLAPARPAATILTFPVRTGVADASVPVPARTAVAAAEPGEDGPIVFETGRALTALNARLAAVQVDDGYSVTDRSAANVADGAGFLPFGDLAPEGAALMLGLDAPAGLPGGAELSLALIAEEDSTGGVSECGTPLYTPAETLWEAWSGTGWLPLKTLADETAGLTRTGIMRLRLPGTGTIATEALGRVETPLAYLRLRLSDSGYDSPPRLSRVVLNAVRAEQRETVEYEVLGGSDGSPDQTFTLGFAPLIADTLELEVDEGDTGGFVAWTEVPDFFGVAPRAPVYVVDRGSGEVRFGSEGTPSGGRIPAANPERARGSIRARIYAFGGGAAGNLPAGSLTKLLTSLPDLDAAAISNPVPATGGTDEETLEALIARAPATLRARERAVTAQDFVHFALQAGPVARARAFPRTHPAFPGIEVPGTVTLVILPDTDAAAPMPSEALRQAVCAALAPHRLIGTELLVTGPDYAPLEIEVQAVADPEADSDALTEAVEAAAGHFLHPLTGGRQGTGWEFGGTVHYGELYQAMLVPGIRRFDDILLRLNGIEIDRCGSAEIEPRQLVELTALSVTVTEEQTEGAR